MAEVLDLYLEKEKEFISMWTIKVTPLKNPTDALYKILIAPNLNNEHGQTIQWDKNIPVSELVST